MPRGPDDGENAGKVVKTDGAHELVWREKTGFSYRYRREKIKKTGAIVRPPPRYRAVMA